MYEAITLGEKNIEMKKSAVHAIYYSRHYYKFKNPDFRAFNNFMASLNNFKEIKK